MTDRGPWILTSTGVRFHPSDPRPEDFRVEDIARGLSNACRFAGQCPRFYSVAEHSVLVSRLVGERYAFEALLHDAEEAYPPGDIPTPIKRMSSSGPMRAIQANIRAVLRQMFALPDEDSHAVLDADRWAFVIEATQLFYGALPRDYFTTGHTTAEYDEVLGRGRLVHTLGLGPNEAYDLWTNRFEELRGL